MRIEDIFNEAIMQADGPPRAAYLADACAGNLEMLERVTALIAAHDAAGDFLKLSPADSATVAHSPVDERPGTIIGRYKLLEQIGEGGFGVVFMAEQVEPVRRRVALKVIKLGMDTKQIVARFEAERQALAMMDHPNIAKVLEAGATDTGRPYFVMELVNGISITSYCDLYKLRVTDRLHLFTEVCSAVQHAHQKGIIHRDLKPTNVLVTQHDDKAVPKIIDFGIAKATQGRLTDRTLFTEFRQMIGTPSYMSPEQSQMSGLDIDTRSDIYSLGVLLYELLTGTTPFDAQQLLSVAYEEMQRIIREVEPPTPSTRLSTFSLELQAERAADRASDPKRWRHVLQGDLDWIVMRCLEKDRTRRYETAAGLAEDIARYVDDQPVEARRPTRRNRLKKFIRRNKVGVLAGSAVFAALVSGLALASLGFVRARRQEQIAISQAARSEQVSQLLQDMLKGAGPSVALGRDATLLREILDKTADRLDKDLSDQPEVQGDLAFTLGNTYREIGDYPRAISMLQHTVDCYRADPIAHSGKLALALGCLGRCQSFAGDVDSGKRNTQEAVSIGRTSGDNQILATCLFDEARSFEERGMTTKRGVRSAQEALSIWKKTGSDPVSLADCMAWLADSLAGDDNSQAELLARESVALHQKYLAPDHHKVAGSLFTLGQILLTEGKLEETESVLQQAYDLYRKNYDRNHPYRYQILQVYSEALVRQAKFDKAEALIRREVDDAPSNANFVDVYGRFAAARGQWRQAVDLLSHAVALDPNNEYFSFSLAIAELQAGKVEEYHRESHRYLKRFENRTEYGSSTDATIAALLQPADDADFELACKIADTVAEGSHRERWIPRVYLCKSLAEIRRNHFESAKDWAHRASTSEFAAPAIRAAGYFLQASALARLQQLEAARGVFAQGAELVNGREITSVSFDMWESRAIADHLHIEASELIAKMAPTSKQ